jgi:hypothetical protein
VRSLTGWLQNRSQETQTTHSYGMNAAAAPSLPSAPTCFCRGVLAVEGQHDKAIIERYGGIDLDKQRVVIVVLQGADHAAGIAELEFIQALRIPVHVVLDHVRGDAMRAILDCRPWGRLSKEERKLLELNASLKMLHSAVAGQRLQVNLLPFQHVDIIRAVPNEEISWALRQLGNPSFPGWPHIDVRADEEFRRGQ